MMLQVKKVFDSNKPVKAWKIVTVADATWYTGPYEKQEVNWDTWLTASGPGFHAFKTRAAAEKALHKMAVDGHVKWPSYVIPCQLKGTVEFGKYVGYHGHGLKGIRGSEMRLRPKDMPNTDNLQDWRFNAKHTVAE
jgi:hypothetical protein